MAFDLGQYLNQKMVYWAKRGNDGQGQGTYLPPVELDCRWDDRTVQLVQPDGRVVTYKAHILTDTYLDDGGLLWKGTLADVKKLVAYPTVPTTKQGVREIKQLDKTQDFDGSDLLCQCWL